MMRSGVGAIKESAMHAARVLLTSIPVLVCLLAQTHAEESRPQITLNVIPSVMKLSPLEAREARIVIGNPTAAPLRELRLSSFTDADVQVDSVPPPSDSLQPHGTLAWTVRLTKHVRGSAAGQVHLLLDYRWQPEAAAELVPGVALGTIEIQDRLPTTLDKVAAVRIETTLDLLHEKRQGSVFLVVSNRSSDPMTVKRIKMAKPSSIVVETPPMDAHGIIRLPPEMTLAPQESRAVPIIVTAGNAVQPGKHLLLFEVDLEQMQYGYVWTETLIATQAFSVGVLGESELLTAIGVPSFLLLPGFLIVVSLRMLWTGVSPKQPLELDPKSAEFWLIAILLSLGAAFLYPLLTGWLGQPRNYLEGYGLRDIVNVWFGSVGLGVALWALWVGGSELRAHLRAQYIPSPDDGPIQILRKLARNRQSISLAQVEIIVGNQAQRAFVIAPARAGQLDIWVAPLMTLTWLPSAGKDEKDLFERLLADGTELNAMADFIERERGRSIEGVSWASAGDLQRPMRVQESQAKRLPGLRRIIEVKEESGESP
jgi:hypothetical protein